jgi:2-keto-4-pentenoate hydratase/2-oxohepta-3-ene-1,7-dioic acid hydratase in catechol pathway
MKLALIHHGGTLRAGFVKDGAVQLLPAEERTPYSPSPIRRQLCEKATWQSLEHQPPGESVPLAQARFTAPVPDPSFLAEVDRLTYLAEYAGSPHVPEYRPVRPLPDTAIGSHGGTFLPPSLARLLHVDVQIACVVGREIPRGTVVSMADIFGLTIMASCREFGLAQAVEGPLPFITRDAGIARMWLCRYLDGSHPLGPWIVPVDSIDFNAVNAMLEVEEVGLKESLAVHAFNPVHTLSQVSPLFAFQPGDVIGLGALTEELVIREPLSKTVGARAAIDGIGVLSWRIDTSRWDSTSTYRPQYRDSVDRALQFHRSRKGSPPAQTGK